MDAAAGFWRGFQAGLREVRAAVHAFALAAVGNALQHQGAFECGGIQVLQGEPFCHGGFMLRLAMPPRL
jgi:hypothetical protein